MVATKTGVKATARTPKYFIWAVGTTETGGAYYAEYGVITETAHAYVVVDERGEEQRLSKKAHTVYTDQREAFRAWLPIAEAEAKDLQNRLEDLNTNIKRTKAYLRRAPK
jgi:hypothetical protein